MHAFHPRPGLTPANRCCCVTFLSGCHLSCSSLKSFFRSALLVLRFKCRNCWTKCRGSKLGSTSKGGATEAGVLGRVQGDDTGRPSKAPKALLGRTGGGTAELASKHSVFHFFRLFQVWILAPRLLNLRHHFRSEKHSSVSRLHHLERLVEAWVKGRIRSQTSVAR